MSEVYMSRDEVAALLPYGRQFLFIDAVHKVKRGETITTSMLYDEGHPLQAAHFERGPRVVPGALIAEQVCQSAFLLGVLSEDLGAEELYFLGRLQSVFEKPAFPPCTVKAVVVFRARLDGATGFTAEVFSGDERIARVNAVVKRMKLPGLRSHD